MRIIIVGAGLGGLAAAYCFARKGHDVQLLERRRELSNKGGGVSIRPGATRVLIAWGLKEQFEAVSDDFKTTYLRDQHTGEIINSTIAVETSEWPDWGTERQNIQQIFYRSAVNAGATISMNCQAEDVNEGTSEASVTLKNGSVLLADLVLVTDGIRSRLRSIVLQDNSEATAPLPSDVTLYGIKVPLQEARRDQALATVCQDTNLNVSFGRDSFIVFRANEKLQNWGGLFGIKGVTDQQGLWDEEGDISHVRKVFSDADSAMVSALKLAPSCDRWRLAEMPDLPRWSSQGGRILLLGDSAHAMYPNAAQGFSLIIEDIAALEYLTTTSGLQKSASFIASTWEKCRKPRAERIKAYAFENTQMFLGQKPRPPKMKSSSGGNAPQNIMSLKHVIGDSSAPFNTASFYKWAYDHDAAGEVQKYLNQVQIAKL